MAKTYAQLLKQGIDELIDISSSLKHQGPQVAKVRRLKYIAGFLGLQKLSDLGFWLEDWLDASGPKLSPMDENTRDLFCNLMTEVLQSVEAPRDFGEFINAESIALRPLYRKEIPVHQLFSLLKDIHPIQFHKRNIFKLPVSVQEAYPYSLRLPSRFLEKADLDSYLSLLYVDLGRSTREDWTGYAEVLQRLAKEGVILYQGAMEVSWEFLRSRKPLLPYYLLYSGEEDPREFLVRWGFSGHVMRMLKRPGEPWSSQGQTLEGEEEFWDIYDLDSGDLIPHKTPAGEGLLAAARKLKTQTAEFQELTPAASPAPLLISEPVTQPEADFFFEIPDQLNQEDPDFLDQQKEKKTPKPLIPGERLTEIPFTLDDMDNPDFSWPAGMDSLPTEVAAPPKIRAEEPDATPPVPDQKAPTIDGWMPEIRTPSWEDHSEDLSESEEILRSKKSNPVKTAAVMTLILVLAGTAGYLGWLLQFQAGSDAYTQGQDAAFLYSELTEKVLGQAMTAGNLFAPSVEGMEPETVTQDFFKLFYPETSGISGFGLHNQNRVWDFYTSLEKPTEDSALLEAQTQAQNLPASSQIFVPLGVDSGSTFWAISGVETPASYWILQWQSLLPPPGKGQGLLILSPEGKVLYRTGDLWKELPDFSFPLSSFSPGITQGPLNYQDVMGRQVLGGFYKSSRGLVVCVVQKPQEWKDLLQLP